MEDVLKERAEQPENQETVLAGEVGEETEEVEGESIEARVFFTNKEANAFKKGHIVEERGFKELVPPFKEERLFSNI